MFLNKYSYCAQQPGLASWADHWHCPVSLSQGYPQPSCSMLIMAKKTAPSPLKPFCVPIIDSALSMARDIERAKLKGMGAECPQVHEMLMKQYFQMWRGWGRMYP